MVVERPSACRLLLVEDEPANRALVRAILTRSEPGRYVIREAESLAEARASLAAEKPDIVLLDVRLPDGSGLDLMHELRGPATSGPTIIVMSASVLPAERQVALASGADAFIAKPYRAADLIAALRETRPPT